MYLLVLHISKFILLPKSNQGTFLQRPVILIVKTIRTVGKNWAYFVGIRIKISKGREKWVVFRKIL